MSETVARTGWPCSPNTSQNTVGHPAKAGRRDADSLQALLELGRHRAGLAHAGQVALDVGHEHRHADAPKPLGDHLQRDGLAGAGGAGDQPVAVGERGQQRELRCRRAWRSSSGSGMAESVGTVAWGQAAASVAVRRARGRTRAHRRPPGQQAAAARRATSRVDFIQRGIFWL